MKSYLTFIVTFFFLNLTAFAQWNWQYPVPQGNRLNDISFPEPSQKIGFAVGDHGTMMKTENGGTEWTILDSLTNSHLKGCHFLNENLGYTVGDSGMIIRYDGGTLQRESSGTHYNLFSVAMASENNIFAIGYQGLVLKSSGDGTWSEINSGVKNTLYAIQFISADKGFIVGDTGTILRTNDAGATWNKIDVSFESAFNDLYFIDANTGFIVGNNHLVLKTTDGGNTWQQNTQVPTEENIYSIDFINDTLGYLSGANGLVLSTINGGLSWVVKSIPTNLTFRSIHMQAPTIVDTVVFCDTVIFCGDNGAIYRSDSCGYWGNKTHSSQRALNTITFLNDTLAYAVGGYLFNKTPLILKSTDGQNWSEYKVDTIKQYLTDIFLQNADSGFITGTSGRLFRADTNLANWIPIKTGVTKTLYSIRFAAPGKGMIVGRDGIILRTTESDTNWQKVESNFTKSLFKLHYKNLNEGAWAVGDDGTILRIKNHGNQISKIPSGTSLPLYDIKFQSDTAGFIVGFGGKILKLKMVGGEISDVIDIPSGVTVPLNEVYFPSPMIGYIAGEGGTILESTDGGNSWLPTLTGTSNNFRGLYFKTEQSGWAIGSGPMIMKTENGGGPVVTPFIPENRAYVSQAKLYPNPASATTRIEYHLTNRTPVQIKAFDLSGRQIKTFLNDMQGKGTHTEQLDISALKKGIYLLIIQTGQEQYAKKLIILN